MPGSGSRVPPAADVLLTLEAAAALAGFRLALRVLPFPRVLSLARATRRQASRRSSTCAPLAVRHAVLRAARLLPFRVTCLPVALAACALLGRQGHAGVLRIGVRSAGDAPLEAHAWVEHEGSILIGDLPGDPYVPFPDLPEIVAPPSPGQTLT